MPFRKSDRIKVSYEGAEHHGLVLKAGAKVTFILDDGRRLSGGPGALRYSDAPLPAGSVFADHYFKKGARVTFEDGGKAYQGTILAASVVDVRVQIDGGNFEPVTLLKTDIRKSDVPAPADNPSIMDVWTVKNYRADRRLSEETTAFSAEVCLDGKVVLKATNSGTGGCNSYYGDHGLVDRLEQDARKWAAEHGVELKFEAADLWLSWAGECKPNGQLASSYLEDFDRSMQSMRM